MSRPQSAETQVRTLKRQLRDADIELKAARIACDAYRGRANKAEQEAADWRRRFDLLLAMKPEVKP